MDMRTNEIVTLSRDCDAVLIPYGNTVRLPKGQQVTITQSLGGSYTVYVEGHLMRIDGKDADALGKEPAPDPFAELRDRPPGPVDEKLVWRQLATCYDPEIPINIVDLGLIYGLEIQPLGEGPEAGYRVAIRMTLTAPGCGMGPMLQTEVEEKVKQVPNVKEVQVELVFDPPWDQSRMSEAAKLQAGLL